MVYARDSTWKGHVVESLHMPNVLLNTNVVLTNRLVVVHQDSNVSNNFESLHLKQDIVLHLSLCAWP